MIVVAEIAALHGTAPLYNAQTVLELLHFCQAKHVVLGNVTPQAWQSGAWRDQENPLLFALEDARMPASAIAPDWAWAEEEHQALLGFLKQYKQSQAKLRQAQQLEAELREVLMRPLDVAALYTNHTREAQSVGLLEAVATHHAKMRETLDEGPGTTHRAKRLGLLRETLRATTWPENTVLVVSLDDLPEMLEAGFKAPDVASFKPGEASRYRALIDRAYRLEDHDDLDGLVHGLLALDGPAESVLGRLALEARFAASGVYLAVGDLESARDLLEAVAMGQFERPSYLPGLTLVRLGQVRDLMHDREAAKRAYQAALGLAWLPQAAKDSATTGLESAFQWAGDAANLAP